MFDVSKLKYRLIAIAENGKQYSLKDFVENLGWEENKNELAMRVTFVLKNEITSAGQVSSIIKPGCLVGVYADYGSSTDEVARGHITKWAAASSGSKDKISITAYDELYNLQESQDYIYYSAGAFTKPVLLKIFEDWGIPVEKYAGPNVRHGKLVYKTGSLSDDILDILDDAKKKGGGDAFIRSAKGKVSVLAWGSNTPVYVFDVTDAINLSHTISTEGLVTRVKIIGQEDDDGRSSVEATVNGLTQYGVRQKIYVRGSDESVADAQSAGQSIINEKGQLKTEITLETPDVPYVRKGDLVYVRAGTLNEYYFVEGIRHNADDMSMNMNLKKAVASTVKDMQVSEKKTYKVGDIVNFHGGTHYISSYPGAKGSSAKAGPAKITADPNCKDNGKAHPWHLVHTDGSSDVYGWVDEGTFD